MSSSAIETVDTQAQAQQLGDLLLSMRTIASDAGRTDLLGRLDAARTRVLDPRLRIVVVGPLKQGKSQFVNALLGAEVCSVGDDETTAVPTVVGHADEASAELVLAEPGNDPIRVPVPLDHLTTVTPSSPLAQGREILRLEVNIPSPLLADGLVVVDTPGVGGHGNPFAASTLGLLTSADAVLVVSDSSQEFTEPEVAFLRQAMSLCPTVACLITKTDLYPHWKQILEADREHLRRAELDAELIPISSMLRLHALRLGDDSLNTEAGFPALYRFFRERVVAHAKVTTKASVAQDLRAVSEHLALALSSELAALRDPVTARAAVDGLSAARRSAEDMQKRSALWQQTLVDGITDLAADIDHDLRDRLRQVTREAEEAVDEGDPGKDWPVLGEWLEAQIAAAVGDNFVWAHERSIWLAELVAEHFADAAEASLPDFDIAGMDGIMDPVSSLSDLESGRMGIASKVLVGMRGSYGGVLMFGLITTFVGLALINPISIGAGVLLGTKAYKEDKEARVRGRRAEAKMAVRKFTDDVSFQVGKESKDRLRHVQRVLRDHFTDIADQALRSINDSLRAAHEAAGVADSERAARTDRLEKELKAVAALRSVALQLDSAQPNNQVGTGT